jgi:sulfide:quinone oxidoreductase
MFQSFYWHGLLPGRDIPGIGSAMPERGKRGLARREPTTTASGRPAS